MKKIFFYIDSFGLGHITRQIALIRAIGDKARVTALAADHLDVLEKSLPGVLIQKTSIGLKLIPEGLGLNVEETRKANSTLEDDFRKGVRKEINRMDQEKPDLIIADIPAEVFVAAHECNIPVFAVSNFGWTIIIEHIFGKDSNEYRLYADAYSRSNRTFMLPFNESMVPFANKKHVGLLRRRITRKLERRPGILTTFGKSTTNSFRVNETFYSLPDGELETQDHIAAAEAVLSKPAYGVVSEAVSAGVPLFLKKRKNFPESDHILRHLEGVKVVPDESDPAEWINEEMKNFDYGPVKQLKKKYSVNSDNLIAKELLFMIE